MKKIYQLLTMAGMALLPFTVTGCQDFLTEDPKGQMAATNFFQTEGDLDASLNALYGVLAQAMYANNAVGFDAVRGDDMSTHPASNKQPIREVDTYDVSDNNTWVDELWTRRWEVVKAANFIIENAGRTPAEQEKVDATLGQAYYWRAYSYYYLVTTWGRVPMVVRDAVEYNMPLAEVEDIYALIVDDLTKAETMLPDNYTEEPYTRNGVNIAVNKAAAKATLSYVYMTMAGWPLNLGTEYYTLAARKAKEVIDGVENGTWNYRLLDEYWQVHSMEWNDNNPEVLLGIHYNLTSGALTQSVMCDFMQDMAYGGGWEDTHGEIKFWKNFPEGPRKEASYFPKIILASEASAGTLRDWWENPDPESPRVSVAPCFIKNLEGIDGAEFDYTNPAAISYNGQKQHQVIRLSEVYCWYAEAVGRAKLGGADKTEAVRVLNEVRNRADGAETNIYSTSMSDEELAEAAYNEHGWEIAGYYWANIATRARDMFRMNRLKDHFEYRKENPEIEVAPGVFVKEAIPVTGVWDDSKMYFPYPARDAANNPNLVN